MASVHAELRRLCEDARFATQLGGIMVTAAATPHMPDKTAEH